MTINERIEAGRRQRRVPARVSRAAWRLDQAERERAWALASAHAEGISIRTLATAVGLSPSRVHQLLTAADLDVWMRRSASYGQQAGQPWKIPPPRRTPSWTIGTSSQLRENDAVRSDR